MTRIINKRALRETVAIIVDGEDEKWYIAKAKEYYPNESIRRSKLKPEMVQKKKCKDLFSAAKEKLSEGFSFVVLILDFDTIHRDPYEYSYFCDIYQRYQGVKNKAGRKNDKWMANLRVLINNPCLEYWYLLHFKSTSKFYAQYEDLKRDLRGIKQLKDYDKCEDYYLKTPDIFTRLGGVSGLSTARSNMAKNAFCISTCLAKGASEMGLLFDFFDCLDNKNI